MTRTARPSWWPGLFGGAAALALGAAALLHGGEAPDVGALPPVVVSPAEELEVRALSAGQTLGGILAERLDVVEQDRLLMAFREQASPRRLRAGTEVTLRYRGAAAWLRGVDVTLNPDETVRLTRDAYGWSSEMVTTPTWTDTLYAAGSIEGSLWTAVVGNPGLDDVPREDRALLIDHLDKTFQWQIDFYRQIQAGDHYRFAFEREVRPDGSMRSGHIISAELVNAGTAYHAIWFDPNGDGKGSYYDLDGRSVRRAFLRKPLEFRRISSRFDPARFHPVLKTWRSHRGVDYAADPGTPIMSTADGVVTHRGTLGGLGNAVVIDHPNGFRTRYGHMSSFAGIHVGSRVRQGQVIGYVGSTGLATGPHLHYEMWRSGRAIDPLAVELPAGDPVPDDQWQTWNTRMQVRVALLDRLPGAPGMRYADLGEPAIDVDDGAEGDDREDGDR